MASENVDACGWSYGVEVSDAEWAARRKWFVDRVKNGYYGRASAPIVSLIDKPPAPAKVPHDTPEIEYDSKKEIEPARTIELDPNDTVREKYAKVPHDTPAINSHPKHVMTPNRTRDLDQNPNNHTKGPYNSPAIKSYPKNELIPTRTRDLDQNPNNHAKGPYNTPAINSYSKNQMPPTRFLVRNGNLDLPLDTTEMAIPPPKRNKPKIDIDWTRKIPCHLRNLPKPAWLVQRDAKIAAEAARQEEMSLQWVNTRNRAVKRAMRDLPPKLYLLLELTGNENFDGVGLVQDIPQAFSVPCSDAPVAQNPTEVIEQQFNLLSLSEAFRNSESGVLHGGEHGGPANDIVIPRVRYISCVQNIPVTRAWVHRPQYITTQDKIERNEQWLAEREFEALENPHGIDTSNPDWLSGKLPVSGTRRLWQDHPKDLLYPATPIEYGPVDWSKVPKLPPTEEQLSFTPQQLTQCTESSVKALIDARKRHEDKMEELRKTAEFLAQYAPSVLARYPHY